MSTGKILLGALAGVAIGAVVGVLLAPDKGSETRKKIARKGGEYTDGLKDKYQGLKGKYNDAVDGVTNKLESLSSKGEEMAQHGKNAVSEAKAAGQTATR
ncbi:MAG TPA: YtxH domain-containing protein [Flavobacterium sp.]|nr:YtxH domain-containing protein [Flavobacterium sp.]